MQGNKFVIALHVGTLAADLDGVIPIPFACTLLGACLVGTNANDAVYDIGVPSTGAAIFSAILAGDSDAGVYYTFADFNGSVATPGQPYPLAAESELLYDIDHDGGAGTAIEEAMLVLWFSE